MGTSAASAAAIRPARGGLSAKRAVQLVAFALAAGAATLAAVMPAYATETRRSDGAAAIATHTLAEANGPGILVLLALPVLITLLPLFARGSMWQPLAVIATVMLGVFVVLGVFTIGWLFVPALVAQLVAACVRVRRGPSSASRRALVG